MRIQSMGRIQIKVQVLKPKVQVKMVKIALKNLIYESFHIWRIWRELINQTKLMKSQKI